MKPRPERRGNWNAPAWTTGLAIILVTMTVSQTAGAATSLWWDLGYDFRRNIAVTTGANTPDKGYDGYTVRDATLDTQSLITAGQMQANCNDLRILYFDGVSWTELPRHLIGCNTAATDIRFRLPVNLAASSVNDNFYVYYGNTAAGPPASLTTTNVYLWFDDTLTDRSTSYVRGRIDPWHGTGWDNSLTWNPAGYYTHDNGDNFTSGYRLGLDERDVYVESEFFHTSCYPFNITTGLLLRGIVASGTGGSETSDHYYASNRGEYPGCQASGYTHDGDIMRNQRGQIAVDGVNPPDILPNQWRRQALAAWLINPTNLSFWDEDLTTAWAALGWPSAANVQVAGTDGTDMEGRGFVALMTAQDQARVRNILVRRYVQPEPQLSLGSEEGRIPGLMMTKTSLTVSDPVSGTVNPKSIPGSQVQYTLTATNEGPGSVDSNSLIITDPMPANTALCVADPCASGIDAIVFADTPPLSGLSYVFARDVSFSADGGVTYTYVPAPDAEGFDGNITTVRINPQGVFAGASGGTNPTFSLLMKVRVDQ